MKNPSTLAALAAALSLAGCERQGKEAPWLTAPTADQHAARFFPVNAGSIHGGAGAQCDDCHGGFDTFRQFDCIHCHNGHHADPATVTAWHAAVPDFAFDSPACYRCHPDGRGGTAVDHAALFPIAPGTKHETAGCMNCHLDRANRLLLGCAGCHGHEQAIMATAHAPVSGYAFDSALCVRCHADAQVKRVASHLPFRITGAVKHAGPGSGGACLVCHPGSRTDKPWATDFKVVTCVDCHDKASVDANHAGKNGYSYTTAACKNCHPDGTP